MTRKEFEKLWSLEKRLEKAVEATFNHDWNDKTVKGKIQAQKDRFVIDQHTRILDQIYTEFKENPESVLWLLDLEQK